MNKMEKDIKLTELENWYKEEACKIRNERPKGLDGYIHLKVKELQKQYLKKREEILNKYVVAN